VRHAYHYRARIGYAGATRFGENARVAFALHEFLNLTARIGRGGVFVEVEKGRFVNDTAGFQARNEPAGCTYILHEIRVGFLDYVANVGRQDQLSRIVGEEGWDEVECWHVFLTAKAQSCRKGR